MNTWRIRLRPRSAWASPLRSDTIFGSVCWKWRELFPDDFEDTIQQFLDNGPPPFLVSDAWPESLLPLPYHASVEARSSGEKKKWTPPLCVDETVFRSIASGNTLSATGVTGGLIRKTVRVQTAIDRSSGTAADGQLFETPCESLAPDFSSVSVYVRAGDIEKVWACFKAFSFTGLGKKASTGLGQFDVKQDPERCEWMDGAENANAVVSLSHFVPAPGDPTEGLWRTHVTYPKFHSNAVSNVFKGSVLMLTPGSVFRVDAGRPKHWYGSVLPMPRPEMPYAFHCGLCLPVPIVWNGNGQ